VECLGRLAALFAQRRRQLAEGVGLTDQQWQVFEEVQREHFMPSLFAARRDSTPAAVSKILRQLVDKGLIVAEVAEHDARQRNYVVTASGQEIIRELRRQRERAIEEVWMQFESEDLHGFVEFASTLGARLEAIALPTIDASATDG